MRASTCKGANSVHCRYCERPRAPDGITPRWAELHLSGAQPVRWCVDRIDVRGHGPTVRHITPPMSGQVVSEVTRRNWLTPVLGGVVAALLVAALALAWIPKT